MTVTMTSEKNNRLASDFAKGQRARRLTIRRAYRQPARDFKIGQLRKPAATDDRKHMVFFPLEGLKAHHSTCPGLSA